ncbi:MAG: hypothetical protein A2202_05150 [Bdellovibrionales bacterium RIFOXYA1_FULL_36_14]|nr:MAG: hypothetical protein A2202_05150 [Bdellovibrionales bacterium RIFOXYA1_FULL_36_14]
MKVIKNIFLWGSLLLVTSSYAFINDKDELKKFNWNGIEVVWMDEPSLPAYDVVIYFAEGALGDAEGKTGETHLALSLMGEGTRRYKREEIVDNLEYFGSSYSANVFHEYSTYRVSGLIKDLSPTMMKICHLFNEANFPEDELKKDKKRMISSLNQMIQDHSELVNRAFRNLTLKHTPFSRPVTGDLSSLNRITQHDLLDRLKFLKEKVKKKIYVNAPLKMTKELESIMVNNCRFVGNKNDFMRTTPETFGKQGLKKIHLITVPKSDKAEVRIGRVLNGDELNFPELSELSAGYLGGGFTSKLMEELRKKKGLVYSVSAYAAYQKYYGRAAIVTSTKDDQLEELLAAIQRVINETENGLIDDNDFNRIKNYMIGSYPFKFEKGSNYLDQLIFLDHIGKDYDQIKKYKGIMEKYTKLDVQRKIKEIFSWDNQLIIILGEKKLLEKLEKFGKVEVHSFEKFL